MLDEPIHLERYQHAWATAFEVERERISRVLGIDNDAIQHIGSSAVPGLAGKPIIDIMIGCEHLPAPDAWSEGLLRLGYEALGEAGVPGRWYFRQRRSPFRNVHVVERNGSHWINNLALRDYLRCTPEACRRYEDAKYAVWATGATSLVAYSRAKQPILRQLLAEALERHANERAG